MRMGLEAIGRPVVGPTAILGDNSAITELVNKEGASSRTRHFERATVLIKCAVLQLIVVVYLMRPVWYMCVDMCVDVCVSTHAMPTAISSFVH